MSELVHAPVDDARRDRGGPAQPLLIARDLKKFFPVRGGNWFEGIGARVKAVDGLSFDVAKGETLGVVGESGCGKSTMAKLVARLIEPDAGELVFDGQGVAQFGGMALKDLRRNLQMVFQDSAASLNPRMTIGHAIASGPQVHGVPAAQAIARAQALMRRVGLTPESHAQRYPHELPGEQCQRASIARALALEPRLLILDEAVAALDKSVQAQLLNLLQELKTEHGLTYLFISRDLPVVQYMADRVVVMVLGRIVESGSVDAVFSQPRHPYTRALLSALPSMDPARRTQHSPLSGEPPNPIDLPSGCRFRDRCPMARPVCAMRVPVMRETAGGHAAACHFDPAYGEPAPFDKKHLAALQ